VTDLLIAAVGFALAYQATALAGSRFARLLSGTGALLAPLVVATLTTVAILLPHALGKLAGTPHSPTEFDAHIPGSPSPWALALLAFFGGRALLRLWVEACFAVRLRSARVPIPAALQTRFARVAHRFHTVAPDTRLPEIGLHACDEAREPFVRGWLRPRVYLHREVAARVAEDHLLAVLLHEAGHARRGDTLVALLYSLAVSPLDLGRAGRERFARWRVQSELACDDFAAGRVGSGLGIAEAIVAVARLAQPSPRPARGPAFSSAQFARLRIQRLLRRDSRPRTRPEPSWRLPAAALLLLVVATSVSFPRLGLAFFCFWEHIVGVYCLG